MKVTSVPAEYPIQACILQGIKDALSASIPVEAALLASDKHVVEITIHRKERDGKLWIYVNISWQATNEASVAVVSE